MGLPSATASRKRSSFAPELRRSDRCIARGVSPGFTEQKQKAPEGRQISACGVSRRRLPKNICRRSAAQTVLAVDFLTRGFVVRASRPQDSIAINDVRPERPHHKSGGSSRKRRRRDRCIARGVSPGFTEQKVESPGGATEFCLRRKPQAPSEEHLPPLRGSGRFRSSRREIFRAYTSEIIAALL